MWSSFLVILQIIKVFLELWKETDAKKATEKAEKAKEMVDVFAATDPKDKASKLNAVIENIRNRS